ncbi:ABC transporter ATP-binding protein [Chelatococcus reniformis]|uniref:ABC transporter ATP-binding protein n=1 Tax=Chelatococcus reniformis TaxID=1494448 RepID=A0A916UM59_9HYPH|nr:ABC transporter ATP-binding protein [Chelatococcus reniformis]GGC78183.1 ABC transporter ATP-binding protein [Chelatococcus reniformis]
MREPLLRLSNVETFYGPIRAIRGVSLDVHQGTIVAVLGANGAGKTTILKTISGVMDPLKGAVVFEGREIQGEDPDRIARAGIAHVPEGRETFPYLTVRQNLLMGAYARRDRAAVPGDLEMVYGYIPRLRDLSQRVAGSMSGGEQQMLAIGRALMSRPRLLLLDEPSLGLSPRLVGEVFELIRRLNGETGLTILVVEQNAGTALATCHFGFVLELGRIVMEDTCENLMAKDDIKEFYLGMKDEGVREGRRWKRRKTWR